MQLNLRNIENQICYLIFFSSNLIPFGYTDNCNDIKLIIIKDY